MTIRGILKTTKYWHNYWATRHIDWNQAYMTPDHPHRNLIINELKRFRFRSVLEVGCAAGANLYKIKQVFPHSDIGGIDWNAMAIETAKKYLPKASVLQVGEATDIYISNKGADILLTDMCYIYLDRKNFKKALKEAKRVAKNGVIFCEFHHENFLKREGLKILTGYNAYNYKKILEKEGFYDLNFIKIKEQDWPGGEPQKSFGWVISARI